MRANEFYIVIDGVRYPVIDRSTYHEPEFKGGRDTLHLRLELTHAQAIELFQDNMRWSCIHYDLKEKFTYEGEDYSPTNPNCWEEIETDWTPFCVAGPIVDHRDGTITVWMGRLTAVEEAVQEVMKNSVTIDEIMTAFAEGVNEI